MFSEVADQHAPVKRRCVKGTPLPWVNSQISDTMKERDWAHRKARKSNSARHWSMYAKLRNKVNGLVRTAKSKYYCDMIEEAKGDSEKVWKAVNEACNRNSSLESIQCIISDGVQHITSQSIASSMNSFFASIIANGGRLVMKAGDLQRPNSLLCFFCMSRDFDGAHRSSRWRPVRSRLANRPSFLSFHWKSNNSLFQS